MRVGSRRISLGVFEIALTTLSSITRADITRPKSLGKLDRLYRRLGDTVEIMAERPPPSTLAVAFASAIIAGLAGYFLGQASSIGVFSSTTQPARNVTPDNGKAGKDDESDISDAGSASEDDDLEDQELKGFEDSAEECKLVLVVRTDLGMTKGE